MKRLIILPLVLIAFSACTSINVVTDYDPARDFTNYKTYRWARVKEADQKDVLSKNSFLRKRVFKHVGKSRCYKKPITIEKSPLSLYNILLFLLRWQILMIF